MSYQNICPANDWFFCAKTPPEETLMVSHVAVWATTEEGKVIGLVGFALDDSNHYLLSAPPMPGFYLHRDQLTDEQLEASKQR